MSPSPHGDRHHHRSITITASLWRHLHRTVTISPAVTIAVPCRHRDVTVIALSPPLHGLHHRVAATSTSPSPASPSAGGSQRCVPSSLQRHRHRAVSISASLRRHQLHPRWGALNAAPHRHRDTLSPHRGCTVPTTAPSPSPRHVHHGVTRRCCDVTVTAPSPPLHHHHPAVTTASPPPTSPSVGGSQRCVLSPRRRHVPSQPRLHRHHHRTVPITVPRVTAAALRHHHRTVTTTAPSPSPCHRGVTVTSPSPHCHHHRSVTITASLHRHI